METQVQQENIPWIEKYRPTHFNDIVLDPMNRTLFSNILSRHYFPHLLFYGPPGTGKTTTIINLINEYQSVAETAGPLWINKRRENVIHLNASDERGIDIIRIQINQFVKSKNLFETGFKFVILDEVDYMTKTAQQALKSLLQTCRNTVRFCLICNYISKIDESLQNEFICVRFNQLPRAEIFSFIRNIAEKENLQLTDEDIETIQTIHKSDIRSIINFIQLYHHMDTSSHSSIVTPKVWIAMRQLLQSKCRKSVLEYIHMVSMQYNMDKRTILNTYFNYIIRNHLEDITPKFLTMVEQITHATDDTPIECLITFMVSCIP